MHFALVALLSGCIGLAEALDLPVVSMPFTVNSPKLSAELVQALGRRGEDGTTELDVKNYLTSYTVQLLIGTPAQNLSVVIDTGSSDLWVMDQGDGNKCNSNSASSAAECAVRFDSGSSSSFSANQTKFGISYGDGSFAQGNFCQDTIEIGSISVENANFALASQSNTSTSVFGIGPIYGESTVSTVNQNGDAQNTYDNILVQMKKQGHINSLTYSLWLNEASSASGSVLFGGVDHSKYSGDITVVPIIKDYKPGSSSEIKLTQPRSVAVMLTGLGLYSGSDVESVASGSLSVLLDSGTSLSYLPNEFVTALAESIGATWSDHLGMYLTTCNHPGGTVFEIAGAQFQIPFNQMMYPLTSSSSSAATDKDGNEICALGLLPNGPYSPDSTFILGETFLRGVYVVYDYEKWEVGIAHANYDVSSEDIATIGTNGVSGASSAASYSGTSYQSSFSTGTVEMFGTTSLASVSEGLSVNTNAVDSYSETSSKETSTAGTSTNAVTSTSAGNSTESATATTSESASESASETGGESSTEKSGDKKTKSSASSDASSTESEATSGTQSAESTAGSSSSSGDKTDKTSAGASASPSPTSASNGAVKHHSGLLAQLFIILNLL